MTSVFNSHRAYTLGLYEIHCNMFCARKIQNSDCDSWVTMGNIIGWIPIIGLIIGMIRFTIGYQRYTDVASKSYPMDEEREAMKGFMIRGTIEMFSLGPLLMIVDLIVTVARTYLFRKLPL